jgi:transcription initiation factor TFIIIB Brf1 subunit/transcription initiation factor TFIIB
MLFQVHLSMLNYLPYVVVFWYWMTYFDAMDAELRYDNYTVIIAAKFLWLCRTNKIPVMLREISRDFGVRTRNIVQTLSETEYIPPLSAIEYINRVSRQLNLPDNIRDHASYLEKEDTTIDNTTPIMRACCAVLKAVEAEGIHLNKWKVTSALGITTVGLRIALKRLEGFE